MAIAFDSAEGVQTSATYSFTHAGDFLSLGAYTYSGSVTGVTIDGVAMSAAGSVAYGDPLAVLWVWILIGPPTGNVAVSISATGLNGSTIHALTGTRQSAQPDSTAFSVSDSPNTATLTTVADDCWAVSFASGYLSFNAPSASTGLADRANDSFTSAVADSNGSVGAAGMHSVTWVNNNFPPIFQFAIGVAPATGAATGQPTMRRWGGVPHLGGQKTRAGVHGGPWNRTKDGILIPRWLADDERQAA